MHQPVVVKFIAKLLPVEIVGEVITIIDYFSVRQATLLVEFLLLNLSNIRQAGLPVVLDKLHAFQQISDRVDEELSFLRH